MTPLEPTADAVAMRHLRHQTKNALQQIIARIATTDVRATPEGRTLADEIERRIRLSARISDALFGLTMAPGPLQQRLAVLCDATVALLADLEQTIQTEISVTGCCPETVETTVVQVAHEMLSNAIKHGMHVRLIGRIILRVETSSEGAVTLTVSDDGWGPCGASGGEGMPIMQAMAARHGGTVTLSREDEWTVARLHLPGAA
jgi:two-component sensor histidine kinase